MSSSDSLKRAAAERAATLVRDGMKVGLGTGSTARHLVDILGARVKAGLSILCVPTSEQTRAQAEGLGIPLTTLDRTPELDLTIDGTDEIDGAMRLIKGGGGAHLREKMVASASKRMVVIADETKKVATLGAFPLPIEVVRFGLDVTRGKAAEAAASAGCQGELVLRMRPDGHVFVTDEGHFILDGRFGRIPDPEALARALDSTVGVVEHGLFIGLCRGAIIASSEGLEVIGALDEARS